jgi:hypothetical protein
LTETKPIDLNDLKIQNGTRERSLFLFVKLRVKDPDIDDYEMLQLKYKRIVQKALESKEIQVKLVVVST